MFHPKKCVLERKDKPQKTGLLNKARVQGSDIFALDFVLNKCFIFVCQVSAYMER